MAIKAIYQKHFENFQKRNIDNVKNTIEKRQYRYV